jgi:hypothetical protein
MSKDLSYVGKTQAIRACLAEHPEATPQRVVALLAARGLQVSPSHVIVVRAVARSQRAEQVAAAL